MSSRIVLEANDVARHFDVSRPALQRLLAGEKKRILRAVDGVTMKGFGR